MGAASLAMFLGLDNRDLLPPFFPPFRSEDGIFGHMLARCRDGACTGHVPLALLHDRPEARGFGDVVTIRMSDLILGALGSCAISIADTSCAERLGRFGKHLVFLGSLEDDAFREWARPAMFARASGIAKSAEAALMREYCYPDYWADDLSRTIERFSKAALDPDYAVPEELRGEGAALSGLGAARTIMRQFGELLCWWPEIVERTRRLAERGIQIGCRIG
jgi:hypothetical protein